MRTIAGLTIAVALCACDAEPKPRAAPGVHVDKDSSATFRNTSWCDDLIGTSVCSMDYIDILYDCYYDDVLSSCLSNPDGYGENCEAFAHEVASNMASQATGDCGYLHQEWWLCEQGYADPDTCTTGPNDGGGGGGDGFDDDGYSNDETCTWCSCQSDSWSYEGEVCGSSTEELVDACWASC